MYFFPEEESLFTPQLAVYEDIIEKNLEKMTEIAGGAHRLWPHVKTHKMEALIRLQMRHGITKFKCATMAEARMCAREGAERVLVAYPLLGPNIGRFLELKKAFPGTEFLAIGDDTNCIKELGKAAREREMTVPLLVDVDVGQHRSGVPLERVEEVCSIWAAIPGIVLRGLHCYDGHRHEREISERMEAAKETDRQVKALVKELAAIAACDLLVMGGTPSFPCYALLNEAYLSPGTCLLQDAGYQSSFPDLDFIPAAAVLTRVISRPGRGEMTLDMGNKAVASDPPGEKAVLVEFPKAKTLLINEEHWVVRLPPHQEDSLPPAGALLHAIPTHICPTVALYNEAAAVKDGHWKGWWEVSARNRRF